MEKKRTNICISILIVVFFLIALISYISLFIAIPMFWVRLVSLIILIGIGVAMIFVLRTRIKEIKKGETDDLSKY